MIKLIEIEITGQDQESFEEVEKDLENIRNWGGYDSISNEMEKVFEREL
jgi:translation elongation factor EF-1beta